MYVCFNVSKHASIISIRQVSAVVMVVVSTHLAAATKGSTI